MDAKRNGPSATNQGLRHPGVGGAHWQVLGATGDHGI